MPLSQIIQPVSQTERQIAQDQTIKTIRPDNKDNQTRQENICKTDKQDIMIQTRQQIEQDSVCACACKHTHTHLSINTINITSHSYFDPIFFFYNSIKIMCTIFNCPIGVLRMTSSYDGGKSPELIVTLIWTPLLRQLNRRPV